MKIGIIRNKEEADFFIKKPYNPDVIISLKPSATYALKSSQGIQNIKIITSEKVYSDSCHEASLQHIQKTITQLSEACEAEGIPHEAATNVCYLAKYITSYSARLYYTIRKYEGGKHKFYWVDSGKWRTSSNFSKCFASLVQVFLKDMIDVQDRFYYPTKEERKIIDRHNRFVTENLRKRKPILVWGRKRQSPLAFGGTIQNLDHSFRTIATRTAPSHISVVRAAYRDTKKKYNNTKYQVLYFFYPEKTKSLKRPMQKAFAQVEDEIGRICLNNIGKKLIELADATVGYQKCISKILDRLQPRAIFTDFIGDETSTPLASEAKNLNIPVYMINHATHSAQTSPTSKLAADLWAKDGRLTSGYATEYISRMPYIKEYTNELSESKVVHGTRFINGKEKPTQSQKFRIIHAANYLGWHEYIPWIADTHEEYIKGLKDVMDAIKGLNNVEMIIRVRNKGNDFFDVEHLSKTLPQQTNVKFKSEGSFADDMINADLLISNASTTIDEALEIQRPVLLYMSSNRYNHLPGQTTAPRSGKRSAVYVAESKVKLHGMIKSIIDYHFNNPLNESELVKLNWDKNTPSITELSEKIIDEVG